MQPETPVISAKIFEGFEAFLVNQGVALAPLVKAAGIEASTLQDVNGELPLSQVCALFELAAQEAGDPCLGLHWAEAFCPGATGVFGYSILNAATLREAMQVAARYLTLVVHPAAVSFEEEAGQGALRWHLSSLTTSSTAQYVGFSVAATVLRLRDVAGPAWSPLAVDLTHREVPCTATVRRIFGQHVHFNAPVNVIYADTHSLGLKAVASDPRLYDLMLSLGNRLIAEREAPADLLARCQRAIIDNVSRGEVTLEATAASVSLAPRTLQSKLAQFGTTFEALLQDTRRNLAVGYLRESDLNLTDIALLLGFSELSAFSRATQRWFGVPPSTYRQRLRGGVVKPRGPS